jgi:hypothetical protein
MTLQLGSAIGTATVSDGCVEGTFTVYTVQGLPPTECALLATADGRWTFIRAGDGPLEWVGTYRTENEALIALADVILQGWLTHSDADTDSQRH